MHLNEDIDVVLTTLSNISKRHSKIVSTAPQVDNQFWHLGCDLKALFVQLKEMASKLNCIPNTTDYFFVTPSAKFLDVGCGTGVTLLLANALGFDEFGIENDPSSLKLLDTIYSPREGHIFNVNALDFNNYGDFDVIFMYRPFTNDTLQKQLEEKIVEQMKPGAVLIPQYLITIPEIFRKTSIVRTHVP